MDFLPLHLSLGSFVVYFIWTRTGFPDREQTNGDIPLGNRDEHHFAKHHNVSVGLISGGLISGASVRAVDVRVVVIGT